MKALSTIWLNSFETRSDTGPFRICIFLFLLICFLQKEGHGQQNNLTLKSNSFGIEEGLSSTTLSLPYMDSEGLIWLGHELGIDRFDGHRVETFSNQKYFPDLGFFYEIVEDATGKFWVQGAAANNREQTALYLFDHVKKQSQDLSKYSAPLPFDLRKVIMIKGTEGQKHVWLITEHQVFKAASVENISLVFETKQSINAAISNHRFLWLQTEVGYMQLDLKGELLKQLPFTEPGIHFMLGEDSSGNLYHQLTTPHNGKMKVSIFKNDKEWQPGQWEDLRFWAINHVTDQVWIRNYIKGRTEIRSLDFELLYAVNDSEITYSDPFYFRIDQKGNAWRNFESKIHMYRFESSLFHSYLKDLRVFAQVGFGTRGICSMSDSTVMVNGLSGSFILNLNTGVKQFLREPANIAQFTGLGGLRRLDAHHALDGRIWLSNETDQILGYDPADGTYEVVLRKGKKRNPDTGDYEEALDLNWALHVDLHNTMWIGQQLGLAFRKAGEDFYEEYENYGDYPELRLAKIADFLEDDSGIWVAASSGLYLLTHEAEIATRFHKDAVESRQIPFNNISQVSKDKLGHLWLATVGGGIIRLNPETGAWQQWTTKDGLSHDVTYAVYPDDFGNLWIPSNRGINRFNPEAGTFSLYTTQDGLPGNEFNTTSHARLSDGRLAFGGVNGLTILDPADFEAVSSNLQLTTTALEVQSRSSGQFYNAYPYLTENDEIRLVNTDIAFVLSFSMLDYMPEGAGQMAYKIEGLDAQWNYTNESDIRFNRLPYGKHLLKVKSQGTNGIWTNELLIPINVIRPFYLQWWFFVTLFALLLGLVRIIVVKREKRLKERQQELEDQVQLRTEKIKKQADELQSLDKLKSTFFTNISHELKTPLTLIAAPIKSVLSDTKLDLSSKEDLQLADRNVSTIQNLINELLDLNRLESGIAQPRYHHIDVNQFFKLIYQNFTPKARALNISYKLESDLPDGKQWVVDPTMTEKIVNNLLSNAFKHVHSGGQVVLSVFNGTHLSVKVSDTGKGISEEDLPFIFDRYFQTKDPNKKAKGGTGIGLAYSNELAQVMNGQLSVESQLNKGSEFVLELPPAEATEGEWKAEVQESSGYLPEEPTNGLQAIRPKLLLVEDQEEMMQFIRKNLAVLFDLETAGNGAEALQKLKAGLKADLIISDMMMPLMDGMELLRQVKSEPDLKDIPMIFLTAKSAEKDKLEAFRLGIDDYLLKPFSMDELKARIKNQLKVVQSKSVDTEVVQTDEEITDQIVAKWLATVRLTTEENADKPDFNLDSIAEKMGDSKSTFTRKLKRYTGYSPGVYLKEIRLQQARKALENGVYLRVNDVARAVGFSSAKYFARQYKERFGKYPSDYLK